MSEGSGFGLLLSTYMGFLSVKQRWCDIFGEFFFFSQTREIHNGYMEFEKETFSLMVRSNILYEGRKENIMNLHAEGK